MIMIINLVILVVLGNYQEVFRMVSSCGIIQRLPMVSILGFLMVSVVAGNVSLWFPSLVSLWFPCCHSKPHGLFQEPLS